MAPDGALAFEGVALDAAGYQTAGSAAEAVGEEGKANSVRDVRIRLADLTRSNLDRNRREDVWRWPCLLDR